MVPFLGAIIVFTSFYIFVLFTIFNTKHSTFFSNYFKKLNTKVGFFQLYTKGISKTILFINDKYYDISSDADIKFRPYSRTPYMKDIHDQSWNRKYNAFYDDLLNSQLSFIRKNLQKESLVLNLLLGTNLSHIIANYSDPQTLGMNFKNHYPTIKQNFIMDEDKLKSFPYTFKHKVFSKLKPFSHNMADVYDYLNRMARFKAFPLITNNHILKKCKYIRFYKTPSQTALATFIYLLIIFSLLMIH